MDTDGVYGIGMRIDVAPPMPFLVTSVVNLQDEYGTSECAIPYVRDCSALTHVISQASITWSA
jgi:hypothetical protein